MLLLWQNNVPMSIEVSLFSSSLLSLWPHCNLITADLALL